MNSQTLLQGKMSVTARKRNKFTRSGGGGTPARAEDGAPANASSAVSKSPGRRQQTDLREAEKSWSFTSAINVFAGVLAMCAVSYTHSRYMYLIHENQLWFSNIKEVEREISFRTESGLYYSYFKQILEAPSITQGVRDLMEDKRTEHPDTINIIERMNIYQEIILAAVYRISGTSMRPIFFYTYCIFGVQALQVSALFLMTWLMSCSWLAGLLAAAFYIFNRLDTTRVDSSVPLRENFALPFLWLQAAALTVYFKHEVSRIIQTISKIVVLVGTFMFCLMWQFNQFIMLLQAFSVFGVWLLGFLPTRKMRYLMLCQLISLMIVCLLQFGNKMILSSWSVSFIIGSLLLSHFWGDQNKPRSVMMFMVRVSGLSLLSLLVMVSLSTVVKVILKVDSDEHIFKFIQNKFGVGDVRDFDSRLYLCLGIFGFITQDIFERLTQNYVLPLYVPIHLFLLGYMAYSVFNRLAGTENRSPVEQGSRQHLFHRPELAFHIVQAVLFGALAVTTLRMKYLWTPYMCVLAAVGVADKSLWGRVLSFFKINNKFVIMAVSSSVLVIILSVLMKTLLPPVLEDLKKETEFWDPDTVQLMEWIIKNTPTAASFTGSMQLLAGVKLCTDRHITNHPHYEDRYLRHKTKQLYQIYGRRTPEDVHQILHKYGSNYIILEDSICRAPSKDGCRTPDLVDIDNGVMPDGSTTIEGLVQSPVPRFCEQVRHQAPAYSKYFKLVLENNTFRVYQVL